MVRLALEGNDRRGLYADVAAAVSATGTDIKSLELKTLDGRVTGSAMVEVENLVHLERIIKAARRVKGVGCGEPSGAAHDRGVAVTEQTPTVGLYCRDARRRIQTPGPL